jgi:hypothetical protein
MIICRVDIQISAIHDINWVNYTYCVVYISAVSLIYTSR